MYFSEGEFETFYYSYPSHFEELIKCLKDDGFEKPLVQTLEEKYDIVIQQMKCTEELTNAAKGNLFHEVTCCSSHSHNLKKRWYHNLLLLKIICP